jgi:DNA polymerase-3 subunit epsilon
VIAPRIAFVDVETTGTNANANRVTEIGIVRVENGRVVEEWSSLVNPEQSIPPAIERLTGITSDMVESAPTFSSLGQEILGRLRGHLFVAHNARFDYGFLKNEFRRAGLAFQEKVLCTVKLSRALYPQFRRHNLDAIMQRHGLGCDDRHRALADARVLWDFMQQIYRDVPASTIETTVADLLKRPALPGGLDPDVLDQLPTRPGVYEFYGEGDALLYVGKSVNLRSRVMSHFSSDHRASREMRMAQQLRRLEWTETAGELGALLLESSLVKRHQPVFNRQLRRTGTLYAYRVGGGGPVQVELVELGASPAHGRYDYYGMFRSPREARARLESIAREQGLCPRLLGLEARRSGPCFSRQLGRCRGACIGEESVVAHNLRMASALIGQSIRSWPFSGPVGIRERGRGGRTDIHVFDDWCYLGTAVSRTGLWDLLETGVKKEFDPDCYRILDRFLRSGKDLDVLDLAGSDRPGPDQLRLEV